MRSIVILLSILFFTASSIAQELNCNVQVVAPQIANTEKKVFESLQTSVYEFMNNTKWTNDLFKVDERIECSILLTVTQALSVDEFKATIQVQSRRPVYKTSYNSTLLNLNDPEFQFKYIELQALEFGENTFTSNLTSVLAYYAYLIIAMDYDSFSMEGGTPYYMKAQTIVNNAQNAKELGWKAYENTKNRYWVIENLLSSKFKPLRQTIYQYHRKGMDFMQSDKEAARNEIFASIDQLQKVHNAVPLSYPMQVFFTAKSDEIVNIFSESFPDTKSKLVTILNQIDPANTSKYQKLSSGN